MLQQHRVLQKHVLLLLLLLRQAFQQHKEVVLHRKLSDRVIGGGELRKKWVLIMCLSWAESSCTTESRRTGKTQRKTNNFRKTITSVHAPLIRNNTLAPVKSAGRPT